MGNLEKYLPNESETVRLIYENYKTKGDNEEPRGYLGASSIGHECERYLWYCFRYCIKPEFDGRMYRLFETGDIEETRFVKNLQDIGCDVYDLDPQTGKQFEVTGVGGHFKGHMDGCAKGIPEAPKTWHVLEFKTHNAKSFKKLVKEGVLSSKPTHYAQMMVYMHLTGMKRALYLARNKDTDELYSERIRYSKPEADALMNRAERIVTATMPPDRCKESPGTFPCKWCDARELCWGLSQIAVPIAHKTCRSCCHATPELDAENGRWSCAKHNITLTRQAQWKCCPQHLLNPGLIGFASVTGVEKSAAGNDIIEFSNEDGTVWYHGNDNDQHYKTDDLLTLPGPLVGDDFIAQVQGVFGGKTVEREYDPFCSLSENDDECLFDGTIQTFATWNDAQELGVTSSPTKTYTNNRYTSCLFPGGIISKLTHSNKQVQIWRKKQ